MRNILILVAICAAISIMAFSGLVYGSERSSTLEFLLAMSPHTDDLEEPAGERRSRLAVYARAINAHTRNREERASLLALGWFESRFSSKICDGETLGDRGKAFGCWQSWERDRSGGVNGQARRAIAHFRKAGNYCRGKGANRLSGAFSLYATGNTCRWPGAAKRAALARSIAWRLR